MDEYASVKLPNSPDVFLRIASSAWRSSDGSCVFSPLAVTNQRLRLKPVLLTFRGDFPMQFRDVHTV
jgi:hypothetical protein